MNKQKLIQLICTQLAHDLIAAKEAALATYDAAVNEESKPENEYDTRGLEASYLAGAQAKRVADIEELVYIYKELKFKSYCPDDPISATALVKVGLHMESKAGPQIKNSLVFIVPKGGGLQLNLDGQAVQTVTPTSPLGEALLGLKVGEITSVETENKIREYEILSIW